MIAAGGIIFKTMRCRGRKCRVLILPGKNQTIKPGEPITGQEHGHSAGSRWAGRRHDGGAGEGTDSGLRHRRGREHTSSGQTKRDRLTEGVDLVERLAPLRGLTEGEEEERK